MLGVGAPFDMANRYTPRTYDEIANIKEYRDPKDATPITNIGSFAAQVGGDARVFNNPKYIGTALAGDPILGGRFSGGGRFGATPSKADTPSVDESPPSVDESPKTETESSDRNETLEEVLAAAKAAGGIKGPY